MELVEDNTGLRINQTCVSLPLENALMFYVDHVVNNIDLATTNYRTMYVRFQHLNVLQFRMVLAGKSTNKQACKKISANSVLLIALMS